MPSFSFTLDSFKITDTRSLHEDTDYLVFTLRVANGGAVPLVKSMGNINSGSHTVGLSFPNVQMGVTDAVNLNYIIVNAGSSSRVDVETLLEKVSVLVAGGVTGFPEFNSALPVYSGWFVNELKTIIHSRCDGIVAAERSTFMINDLRARPGGLPFTQSTKHPGYDSPAGAEVIRTTQLIGTSRKCLLDVCVSEEAACEAASGHRPPLHMMVLPPTVDLYMPLLGRMATKFPPFPFVMA
jgi:hypothetical protein